MIDPGRQAARTRLAWSRTALGCFGNALLVALRLPDSDYPALTAVVLGCSALLGVGVLLVARGREAELAHADRPSAAPVRVLTLGLLVCLLCLLVGVDLALNLGG